MHGEPPVDRHWVQAMGSIWDHETPIVFNPDQPEEHPQDQDGETHG